MLLLQYHRVWLYIEVGVLFICIQIRDYFCQFQLKEEGLESFSCILTTASKFSLTTFFIDAHCGLDSIFIPAIAHGTEKLHQLFKRFNHYW